MQLEVWLEQLEADVLELSSFDVSAVAGTDAANHLTRFSRVQNQIHLFALSLAARAIDERQHAGAKNAAAWVGETIGLSEHAASTALATQSRIEQLPSVSAAVAAGDISIAKANLIAKGAEGDVGTASELLSQASDISVDQLRGLTLRQKMRNARSESDRHDWLRSERSLSHWVDDEGFSCLLLKNTAEVMSSILSRQRASEAATPRESGSTWRAHKADAFYAAFCGRSSASKPRTEVVVHVDYEALMRGRTESSETCEVAGLGPIPVALAQSYLNDCVLKLIITESNKALWFGETNQVLPERLRQAALARDRNKCVRCHDTTNVQVDHIVARVSGGAHQLTNLQTLCWFCHAAKTKQDAPWTADYVYGRPHSVKLTGDNPDPASWFPDTG